jgi:hypothetical protein
VKILEGLEIENFDIFDGLLEFITDIWYILHMAIWWFTQ